MIVFPKIHLLLSASALLACLGACANQTPASQSSAAARSACRSYADEVFQRQNAGAVYQSDTYSTGLRDSPFGSSGLPGLTTTGLSQQYGIDTTMQNCLNGTGGSSASVEPSVPGAPPGATTITNGAPAPATVK
jgi:hypothetical protein